ncbi:MAG: ATP-binding protein [Sulfurimonas sp.]|nr:ATP-binding protein [Sulfurimonas sp.]
MHYHIKILEKKLTLQQNQIILKNQKAQMGGMMAAITHQWKQPLTTISSIVMLIKFKLENNDLDLKELNKKIEQIDSNIYFLAETIDDFKNFLSAKKTKTQCNLNKLIQRAIDLSSDEIMANDIIIHQDLNFSNKTILLYENELLHIILNIIQNAKEAFKENKETETTKMIKIIGSVQGDATYISIMDNAGGISSEQLPHIFEENYTTKQSGTGLGLYLSKVIIQEHLGGSIEAKNIGDGTMFRIRL